LAPELSVEDRERVARLAERVRAPLADRATALVAITHKSWVNEHRGEGAEDNERLEFLGDAVVDLLVSEYLMSRFPLAREGDLSKLRAAVVDEPGLAAMGRALQLGELLRLGRGEELTGGREKASVVADAMEAVIAAVFLDGGLAAVHRLIDPFLEEAYARAASGSLDRDFKTQLQELAQARFRTSPRYRVVAEVGPDHSKIFEIEVELRGEVLGRGSGRSKKDAEQGAARVAVEALAAAPQEPGVAATPPVVAAPPLVVVPPAMDEPAPAGPEPAPPRRKARKTANAPKAKPRKPSAAGKPRKGSAVGSRKIAVKPSRD
jgi:ribonuclease-3